MRTWVGLLLIIRYEDEGSVFLNSQNKGFWECVWGGFLDEVENLSESSVSVYGFDVKLRDRYMKGWIRGFWEGFGV